MPPSFAITWSLSPAATVVPPGNTGSPAASPLSLLKAAVDPPCGAPALFPALEAEIERTGAPPSGVLFPGSALVNSTQEYYIVWQQEEEPKHIHPDEED